MADDTTSSPSPSTLEPADPSSEAAEATAQGETADQVGVVEQAPEASAEQTSDPNAEQSTPALLTTPPEPSVATTLVVEPAPASLATQTDPAADEEGGEWDLLLQKVRQWLNQGELQNLWSQARKPVTLLAAVIGLLLVLRVYSAVLSALDSLPLVPGLLELAGLVWMVRYGVPKLLRSSERDQLLSGLSNRWKAFRGKG